MPIESLRFLTCRPGWRRRAAGMALKGVIDDKRIERIDDAYGFKGAAPGAALPGRSHTIP